MSGQEGAPMKVRLACPKDLPELLRIYAAAREAMRRSGNPTQWGNNRPSQETLEEDIRLGRLYALETGERLVGAFVFFQGPEPSYEAIDGHWLNLEPYSVIHRIASDGSHRGVLARCLAWCEGQTKNLRIDTHRDNRVMRHLLEKNGFIPCGTILAEDGTPRIAYQKA